MIIITVSGIIVSVCALLVIARHDPMRLRVIAARAPAQQGPLPPAFGTARRRVLIAVAVAPGAILLAVGGWAPLVIWVGSLLVCGWALGSVLNYGRGNSSD